MKIDDENRCGVKLELVRIMLGQTVESFCELANIDIDDYNECIRFSKSFHDVDLNTLYRLYYILDQIISSNYTTGEIIFAANQVILTVRDRIEEFLSEERHVAGQGKGVPAVIEAGIILSSSSGIPDDKINVIFKAYYTVSDIINNCRKDDPLLGFCSAIKEKSANGISDYVNKLDDSNNRNRN